MPFLEAKMCALPLNFLSGEFGSSKIYIASLAVLPFTLRSIL